MDKLVFNLMFVSQNQICSIVYRYVHTYLLNKKLIFSQKYQYAAVGK